MTRSAATRRAETNGHPSREKNSVRQITAKERKAFRERASIQLREKHWNTHLVRKSFRRKFQISTEKRRCRQNHPAPPNPACAVPAPNPARPAHSALIGFANSPADKPSLPAWNRRRTHKNREDSGASSPPVFTRIRAPARAPASRCHTLVIPACHGGCTQLNRLRASHPIT